MCTSVVSLMDLDRGMLARIDRKLLAGLGDDEAFRTLRVPATGAKWATWKRYCDAAGVSMGRAVAALIDRELLSVFGEHTADESPVFAQQAVEELANREARIEARERIVDTEEARMHERSERLRCWEDALEVRELQADFASKIASRHSTDHARIGRNERCPCGSGLKYKRCHGLAGRRA
jgi:preprotein translocase subunit SecA